MLDATMSKSQLTSQHISDSFGWKTVSKARILCRQNLVLDWGFDILGTRIIGRVQDDNRSRLFKCEISFSQDPKSGNFWLSSQCTCPDVRDCVHAAAVAILASEEEELVGDDFQVPSPDDGDSQSSEADSQTAAYPAYAAFWLKRLGKLLDGSATGGKSNEAIIYIFSIDQRATEPVLQIEPSVVKFLKNGKFSQSSSYNWQQLAGSRARYVQEQDQAIARLWTACAAEDAQSTPGRPLPPPVDGEVVDLLLKRIIASGRAYFDNTDMQLKQGMPREGHVQWAVQSDWRQSPQVVLNDPNPNLQILYSSSPWYLDKSTGEAGPIALPYARETFKALMEAPRIAPKDAQIIYQILQDKQQDLPLPQLDVVEDVRAEKPTVRLMLKYDKFPHQQLVKAGSQTVHISEDNTATLTFDYGFDAGKLAPSWESYRWSDGKRFIVSKRDFDFEQAVEQRMTKLSFKRFNAKTSPPNQSRWITTEHGPRLWEEFMQQAVPLLKAEGWSIESDPSFQYRIVESSEDCDWLLDVSEDSDFWFSLDLGILIDGKRQPLLPIITEALRSTAFTDSVRSLSSLDKLNIGGKFYCHLPDGRLLALPFERVKDILSCLRELFSENALSADGRLSVSLPQLNALQNSHQAEKYNWQGSEAARQLAAQISEGGVIQALSAPETLQAKLRPYQEEGLGWLDFISTFGFGGVLADDMGLGKTVQTLAHIAREKELGRLTQPCLVLCPTSVLPNWLSEIQRLTPNLRAVSLHGPHRFSRFSEAECADIVLSTYPLLARDSSALTAIRWHGVILDEAQAIKNSYTRAAQAVLQLKSKYRLCLSGTPVENHLGELWSQFNFLMPGLLGTRAAFDRIFRNPIEAQSDTRDTTASEKTVTDENTGSIKSGQEQLQLLRTRVQPFLLRRTKGQVATDLPPKTEMIKFVELDGPQRDLYETVRLSMHKQVLEEVKAKGLAACGLIILDALMKLRQTCCHPGLVKLAAANGIQESAKLDFLMEMLDELLEEKRQILVFSQFTSMLDLIAAQLKERSIEFVQLRGDTRDRATPVRRFQAGEVAVFLISLKAGGTGLNLTAADTVIHFDPWWNPAAEDQATDRAHRIGQDKPVFVYRIIAAGTIEERMLELQKEKRHIAESILATTDNTTANTTDHSTTMPHLDETTLQALFAPLPDSSDLETQLK